MPADNERVRNALETYADLRLSTFAQGIDRDLSGTGMCKGMCLDWARRILNTKRRSKSGFGQPGRSAFLNDGDPPGKTNDRLQLIKLTHDTFPPAAQRQLDAERYILREACSAAGIDQLPNLQALASLPADTYTAAIAALQTLKADPYLGQRAALAQAPTMFYESYTKFQSAWKAVAKKTKPGFIFSKQVERESTYDDIFLADKREPWIAAAQPWTVLSAALNGLGVGRVALVLFNGAQPGRHTGHAVAFYRASDDGNIYYMDPNFGEFYGPQARIGLFFSEIWDAAYNDYILFQYYVFASTQA
jgi:hypothetical protein